MKEKFLPIGSVLLLEGGTKKVMITGYFAVEDKKPDKIYDYSGCMFPEGYLSSDQTCLFNHDQIAEICFEGYQNDEQKEFEVKLINFGKELENQKQKSTKMEVLGD